MKQSRLKVVIFAQTPPPLHGQSQMVERVIEGLRANPELGIECFHVNAKLSASLVEMGSAGLGKLFKLVRYCGAAIALRFRTGARTLYYVPAPPKRATIYRDWIVMLLLRPFFRRLIFHWQAVGLGEWLDQARGWERALTYHLLRGADLSISLSRLCIADAERFAPRQCVAIPNCVPDPCPDFDTALKRRRQARPRARQAISRGEAPAQTERVHAGDAPETIHVLYLAHCTRTKGVFDTMEGVCRANAQLQAAGGKFHFRLKIAGGFMEPGDESALQSALQTPGARESVTYLGAVYGEKKLQLFREADIYCLPTFYPCEGLPLSLIEAFAFGLPVVTTRWRAIPEFVPPDYVGLIDPEAPEQMAAALLQLMLIEEGTRFRELYRSRFDVNALPPALADAFRRVETGPA